MIILLQIYKTFPIFIEINKEMWLFYIKIDVIVNNSPRIFIESCMFFPSRWKFRTGFYVLAKCFSTSEASRARVPVTSQSPELPLYKEILQFLPKL